MHELSIAVSLIDAACEKLEEIGSGSVRTVYLKVGALSGVVCEALEFSFETAKENTLLEDAVLEIDEVPAVAFCPQCEAEKQLSEGHPMFRARCPDCGTPTPELRQGEELEITALEVSG